MTGSNMFNLGRFTSFRAGEQVALTDLRIANSPRDWSGAELAEMSDSAARGLLARGFRPGDRIAMLGENSAEFLVAFSAMLKAKLVPIPINYRLPADLVAFVLRDSGARAV